MAAMTQATLHSSEHSLALVPGESFYLCTECGLMSFEFSRRCNVPDCNYTIHPECEKPPTTLTHHLSPRCHFSFSKQLPPPAAPGCQLIRCDACGDGIQKYMYLCSNTRPGDAPHGLHVFCSKLKRAISSADGDLKLRLENDFSAKCKHCMSKYMVDKKGRKFKGWAYVSEDKKLCYHVKCLMEAYEASCFKRLYRGDCGFGQLLSAGERQVKTYCDGSSSSSSSNSSNSNKCVVGRAIKMAVDLVSVSATGLPICAFVQYLAEA